MLGVWLKRLCMNDEGAKMLRKLHDKIMDKIEPLTNLSEQDVISAKARHLNWPRECYSEKDFVEVKRSIRDQEWEDRKFGFAVTALMPFVYCTFGWYWEGLASAICIFPGVIFSIVAIMGTNRTGSDG
jgi:hypothetical protein